MSAYELPRDGIDAQVKGAKDTADAIRDLRGANQFESAVINGPDGITVYNPTTGARMQYANGRLRFWSNYDTSPDEFGLMLVDPVAGLNYLRFFPPHFDGTGSENSIAVQGRRSGLPGAAYVFTDGQLLLDAKGPAFLRGSSVDLVGTGAVRLTGSTITFDASEIRPYGMATVSASANVVVDIVGGIPILKLSTSSRRYKQDIEDLDIDTEAVLRWRPRTWRDINAVDDQGDDAAQHVGFIAEEIHAETPEFVVLDDEGQPNALKYDRMVAGLLAVVQQQNEQIADLTARVEALENP